MNRLLYYVSAYSEREREGFIDGQMYVLTYRHDMTFKSQLQPTAV